MCSWLWRKTILCIIWLHVYAIIVVSWATTVFIQRSSITFLLLCVWWVKKLIKVKILKNFASLFLVLLRFKIFLPYVTLIVRGSSIFIRTNSFSDKTTISVFFLLFVFVIIIFAVSSARFVITAPVFVNFLAIVFWILALIYILALFIFLKRYRSATLLELMVVLLAFTKN